MLILVALKIVATSLTIGSGGSGGVFAPGLFIGGMLGGGAWWLLHNRLPGFPPTPAPFVIIGMMALFGGVAKAPIAVILMVAEMTGEFSLLVPAMFAATAAYLVSGDTRIYESQVPTRAQSPAHRAEYMIPLIANVTVGQAMQHRVVTAAPSEPIEVAEQRMRGVGTRSMPVVDSGRLVGMFTTTDALRGHDAAAASVEEVMATNLVLTSPDDSLHTALQRMTTAGIFQLPVVQALHPERLVGLLTISDLASTLDIEVRVLLAAAGTQGSGSMEDLELGQQEASFAMSAGQQSATPDTPRHSLTTEDGASQPE
jgi:CIC family chloride channel protein